MENKLYSCTLVNIYEGQWKEKRKKKKVEDEIHRAPKISSTLHVPAYKERLPLQLSH